MENTTEDFIGTRKGTFPARVAEIIDDYKLVINKGEKDGIRKGQRMLVYRVSEEDIKDPETGESLGYLELVRGTGKIIYIQEKMSILESDKSPLNSYWSAFPSQLDKYIEKLLEGKLLPFENPQIGDKVKPI